MKSCHFPSPNTGKLEFSKQACKSRAVCRVFRFFVVCLFKRKVKHLSSKKAEEQEDGFGATQLNSSSQTVEVYLFISTFVTPEPNISEASHY